MYLFELFDDEQPDVGDNDGLQQDILDVLTPLAAQKVPFVTVQQVIDKLREFDTGIHVDRAFVMNVLDPNKMKLVQKIEGDKIFLNVGGAADRKLDNNDQEQEQQLLKRNAQTQAKKAVTGTEKSSQAATQQAKKSVNDGGPF